MPRQEDRVTIKYGPARYDTPKAIRDKIDEAISEAPAGGGITIDQVEDIVDDALDNYQPVTGGVGSVIGIPPGTPFVYVPANLAENPANLVALGHTRYNLQRYTGTNQIAIVEGGKFSEDTADILGLGAGTVMNDSGTDLYAYNPDAGSMVIINHTSVSNVRVPEVVNSNRIVLMRNKPNATTTNITTQVYNGSTWSSVTFTAPASSYFQGMGVDDTGQYVCIVWAANTLSTTTLRVSTYNTTGGAAVATTTYTSPLTVNTQQAGVTIENGFIILYNEPDTLASRYTLVAPANTTGANVWKQISFPSCKPAGSEMTIGSTGIGFAVGRNYTTFSSDVFRFNYNTSTTEVFAAALDGVMDQDSITITTQADNIVGYGMDYVSDDDFILCGFYYDQGSPTFSDKVPLYVTGNITSGTLSLSTLAFGDLIDTTNNDYTACQNPVLLASGDVIFVAAKSGASSYDEAYLYQVSGP